MEIIGGTEQKPKPTVTIPVEFLDPKGIKLGQQITKSISGRVKKIDEEYGVTLELSGEGDEDLDEFESMEPEAQEKKVKKQFESKNKLEEY